MSTCNTQATQATQGGAGTEKTSLMISGVNVDFPCKAYPSQMAMMSKVIQGLKSRKNCLLESPTGSGKTLALLCSALAWQRHEAIRVEQHNAEVDARQEAALAHQVEELRKKKENRSDNRIPEQRSDLGPETECDSSIDVSTDKSNSNLVFEVTEDEDDDDDFKPTKRTRISSSVLNKSNYTSDSSSDGEALKGNVKVKKGAQQPNDIDEAPYFVPYEKKLTVPKIFFGTRTHKQIAQITRELKKTNYRSVRSVILASRDHTCVNPAVEKSSNKNELCRELVQNGPVNGQGCLWHTGARKLASFEVMANVGLSPGYDLEDLVMIARRHKSCPYYVTRFLMVNADIIFCPYNYIIDPNIRKTMNLEINGHVLIFDEAHNMEDAAREASNLSLKQDEIQRAIQECEKVSASGNEPYAHNEISKFLSQMSQWMDAQSHNLEEHSFNSSSKCWTGTEFLAITNAAGMTTEDVQQFSAYFEAIVAQRDKQMEGQRERGTRWFDDKPMIGNQTLSVVENVFRVFAELTRGGGKFRDDFRVALSKEMIRQRRDGNTGSLRTVQILCLNLWCLNPAVAFDSLRGDVHSIVLTSGTLSPMKSFQSELGTLFPITLEAGHVIDTKSQVWAAKIGTGPNGCNLNGSLKNTSTHNYQDELGCIISRVCEIMPHGVLCFFPSYRMLDSLSERWAKTGLLDKLAIAKEVLFEPRSGPDAFQNAMDSFYGAVEGNPSGQTGAIFFAVCRGKVSEGLDFADNNARAVICVGIPFPNFMDMQVKSKREYNDKNLSRGLLSGSEWYEIQAFRALNQALGRCIRHRNDWGAILLIDERYVTYPRYVQSLSKWIRSSVQGFPNWPTLEESLSSFRDRMMSLERPLASSSFTSGESRLDRSAKKICSHDGACGCTNNSWIGMNKDNRDSYESSMSKGGTSEGLLFANSFSSNGSYSGDSAPNSGEIADGLRDDSKSPYFKENSNPLPAFNLNTPSPVFSKKNGRGRGKRVENKINSSPSTSAIAAMFKKQEEKNKEDFSFNMPERFVPNQIKLAKSVPDTSKSTVESRNKRPREKKLKL